MPFEVNIISTGSHGNCIIIDGVIMVDCGVSKKLLLQRAGQDALDGVDQILISHEHGDHLGMSVLNYLAKNRPHLITHGLHVNEGTLARMGDCTVSRLVSPENMLDASATPSDVVELRTRKGVYTMQTFKLFHDVDNQGFIITNPNGERLLHATDTQTMRHAPDGIYDVLLVEGNWDETKLYEMLESDSYEDRFRATRNLRHLSVQAFDRFVEHHANAETLIVQLHESAEFGTLSSKSKVDASGLRSGM